MNFFIYIKNRTIAVLAVFAMSVALYATLYVAGVDTFVIWYCICLIVIVALVGLIADYIHRRAFYRELSQNLTAMSEHAFLAPSMSAIPATYEERLFHEALVAMSKSMMDRLAESKTASREYREYIEMWVHEIKTPISAAHLIAQNNPDAATDAMDVQLSKVESLVEQALFYARGTALDRDFSIRPVSLEKVVRVSLRTNARALIDAHVTPRLEHLACSVRTDPKWLSFIVSQLLINAAKYRREDLPLGTSFVTVSAVQKEVSTGTRVTELIVADNGIGIPEQDLSRVFDKAFTGENGRRYAKSTGIGLYLVHQLCTKMGLSISVTSQVGAGTTFTITFRESMLDLLDA
ncbi:HAMP domain-containing sensor histidine kinase [Atopobium sp. oral taxon 199]|uniref:sensor histidine kinase n=1 Tax=Atopobium sp. oral taxon 199 TaxID=712156 RepID=UPI00034E7B74|nr:sensor histidine kinase [Atopobium sp. oral taxon 199]EPD78355.1 hypothetical protein HMPREF1527_00675 [Atopobium sp. oral taxon 199 str. F0494]